MKRHCITYTTDSGYLLPTLVSAMQASVHAPPEVDVVICHVGALTPEAEAVRDICSRRKLIFISVDRDAIDDMHIMYARLFLDSILPSVYDDVVYVDGDTQLQSDLTELVRAPLPDGAILAARDPMVLAIDRNGPEWRARRHYFESLGFSRDQMKTYFNSGVLRFGLKDWSSVRADCLRELRRRPHELRFPDQDVLNLCCQDRHLTMSFKWNFPIFFLNCGVRDVIGPRIYHFMSNPRPWHGQFNPWGQEFAGVYDEVVRDFPQISNLRTRLSMARRAKYFVQQYVKLGLETLTWNTPDVHRRVAAIEEQAFV